MHEELGELEAAIREGTNTEEELGDLLFAAAGIARFVGCDPEAAIAKSSEKFISRFRRVEELTQGRPLGELALDEIVTLWNTAKAIKYMGCILHIGCRMPGKAKYHQFWRKLP